MIDQQMEQAVREVAAMEAGDYDAVRPGALASWCLAMNTAADTAIEVYADGRWGRVLVLVQYRDDGAGTSQVLCALAYEVGAMERGHAWWWPAQWPAEGRVPWRHAEAAMLDGTWTYTEHIQYLTPLIAG